MKKTYFLMVLLTTFLMLNSFVFSANAGVSIEKGAPARIALPIPAKCEMVVGDSRVIDVSFYSRHNKLKSKKFKTVTKKGIQWTTNPEGIISVDPYGRVKALRSGIVTIKATAIANPKATAKRTIIVVEKASKGINYKTPIVNFNGQPATPVNNLQKIIVRYTNTEIESSTVIPPLVKQIYTNPTSYTGKYQTVTDGSAIWQIVDFADGSTGKYILRTDTKTPDKIAYFANIDKTQYFMGNRYLPNDGKSPVAIASDGSNGIWVIGTKTTDNTPVVTHIEMVKISYSDKAAQMVEQTDKDVLRMGLASGAHWNGTKWIPEISDNDGLWTSMFGAGELMRYAVLKKEGATADQIAAARANALKSLKAVLMLANISGRTAVVNSKIHYLTNTFTGPGNKYSAKYLKYGAVAALDNYVGSPADHMGTFGIDAGTDTPEYGHIGGVKRFTLEGINPGDWITTGKAATTKRVLKGFIARSFCIPSAEDVPYGDGLFIQRDVNKDGKPDIKGKYQKVLSGADRLYDYTKDQHPVLKLGNKPIPKVLQDVLTLDGKKYDATQVAYKGDTSTDEIVGHLFIYKIAYDILSNSNPEEKALKHLIVKTVTNLAQHYIDNGYSLVDATGEGTTWGKTTRNYFNSDFTLEDNSLNSLVVLDTFKLAYYMTGQLKWEDEYLLLANKKPFEYAKLAGTYWAHWMWINKNIDYEPSSNLYMLSKGASKVEMRRHAYYCLNHSDEEMAMLGYYLLFQMETNKALLKEYRVGLNGWWESIKKSENPLWYYIYQLAYPNTPKTDAYKNNLVQTASWALSRHPIDTVEYQAYIPGSRSDVLKDNSLSINPNIVIGKRTSITDRENADIPLNKTLDPNYNPENIYQIKVLPQDERSLHKFNGTTFTDISSSNSNDTESSTTYTLPYWLGRYHGMLN
jgi:hypothetical protein